MYDKPYLKQNFEEFQKASVVEQIMDWCDKSPAPFKTGIGDEVRSFLRNEYDKNPNVNVFDLYHSVLNKKDFFNEGTYYAIVEEPLTPDGEQTVCRLKEFPSYHVYLDSKRLLSGSFESLWEGTASDVCSGLDCVTVRSFDYSDPSQNKVWYLENEVFDIVVKRLKNESDFYKNHFDINEVRDFLKTKLYTERTFESFSALCRSVLDNEKLQHNETLKEQNANLKEPVFVCNSLKNKKLNNKNKSHKI